jgi:hypothetical protein
MQNFDRNIGFSPKIAENCDHNIDPRLAQVLPLFNPKTKFWYLLSILKSNYFKQEFSRSQYELGYFWKCWSFSITYVHT